MDTTKSNRFPYSLLLIVCIAVGLFIYMSIPKKWEDATTQNEDSSISLSKDWADAVEQKKEQYTSHELYVLSAAKDSYFLCQHCPTGRFFLKELEVYRYGTTGNGQDGRGYNESWLAKNFLNYQVILTADLSTVKTEEANLIGSYAILPENLKRPLLSSYKAKPYWYRLVLPPGNNSLD